jgi:hypothetical protein
MAGPPRVLGGRRGMLAGKREPERQDGSLCCGELFVYRETGILCFLNIELQS